MTLQPEINTASMQDLIVGNQKYMRAYALNLTRNHTVADDVFQSACLNALSAKRPEIYNARSWLCACVRSAFLNRRKKEMRYVGDCEASLEKQSMDGAQSYAVELADIGRAMGTLSPGRREAFRLVAIEGMDCNEAGAVMGISRQAVSVQYRRAKALLFGRVK